MSAAHAAIFDGLFAVLIVDGTLLRITEDFICFVDFLELFLVTTCIAEESGDVVCTRVSLERDSEGAFLPSEVGN